MVRAAFLFLSCAHSARALLPPPARWVDKPPPSDLIKPAQLSCFLTQRCVQQQLYYYSLNADGTTHDYLAEFLRPPPNDDEHSTRNPPLDEDYHGVAALPTRSSRDYFCQMLEADELAITIKKEMGCGGGFGHGGLNTLTGEPINRQNNPYIKKRYFEYTTDINPPSIASRLFAIRAQLAEELAADLRDLMEREDADVRARALFDEDRPAFDDSRLGAEDGGRASPFRAANYELVLQLLTAKAVEGLIDDGRAPAELGTVWAQHRDAFFRHNQWSRGDRTGKHSVTDNFLKDLVFKTRPSADGAGLECPADAVLERRLALAAEWSTALDRAPEEHLRWNAWRLEASLAASSS